jgi:HEAT repeat protein
MSTLDEIQRLSDGKFHQLGDDLLRRFDPRYRRLRTHGLNERGESIKGQPDSYVGDTAASCVVAVCYTVQRSSWWNKVVEDVHEAVAASPTANEVVVVVPHNVDRDGPRDKNIDWLSNARTAAGKATLRLIDGREISRLLDTDHQDLRHEHLGIPYSRLSGPSVLAGCRAASQQIIEDIRRSGRYDPTRYVPRSADRELYRLWQKASRPAAAQTRQAAPVRLIALVNDSGVGKTSLVCQFVHDLGSVLPALIIQARDLLLSAEDGLVSSVIQSIQGFLDPSARVIEEAALCKHLSGTVLLTVVLDGLDEAHDSEAVRRTISHWLRSSLGQSSILIVTSRREFWRVCEDPTWERWMPKPALDNRSPVNVAEPQQPDRVDPVGGIRLPDRFTEDELEAAWLRAGQARQRLFALPAEVRGELRHPFTLRVFLELRSQDGGIPPIPTRVALLECWLNRRLDAESLPRDRITRSLFQRALRTLASRAADANSGSICVDDLSDVPRFNPAHPPGPVLQRLIEANILEPVPGQPDRIRFAVEAVQDFYRAEADIEEIRAAPAPMAEAYSRLSFTAAYTRLERVGHRLADESVRDEFARRLAELDARMATVVVRASVGRFSPDIRRKIAEELGRQVSASHRVRAAMAISLLGGLVCLEACEALEEYVLSSSDLHRYLKTQAARAFIKLGHAPAAPFVYRWARFGLASGNHNRYFRELLGLLRGSSPEFRLALAHEALQQLTSPSGSTEHVKAVVVLAYLGDARLVSHLEERLIAIGWLRPYETHALIALGTDQSGTLFSRCFTSIETRLSEALDDQAKQLMDDLLLEMAFQLPGDIRYLVTPAFEPYLKRLLESTDSRVTHIAVNLVRNSLVAPLLYHAAVAVDERRWHEAREVDHRACVTPEVWQDWWQKASNSQVRRRLLRILPLHPSSEVEEILIQCLDSPELCSSAARKLGDYGVVRSAACLRGVLVEARTGDDRWAKAEAAHALGDLRDEIAVPLLADTARVDPDEWVVRQAAWSLGLIGGREAEGALEELLRHGKGEKCDEVILEALLLSGSRTAVGIVLERTKSWDDGPRRLFDRLDRLGWVRGSRRGEYYTHIECDDLVTYLRSQYPNGSPGQDRNAVDAFRQIDGPSVRALLREWAERSDSIYTPFGPDDPRKSSNIYSELLQDRGDESAIDYTLDEWDVDRVEIYVSFVAEHLHRFSRTAVLRHLRLRLAGASTAKPTAALLALLGRFGEGGDADLAARFLDHPDDQVVNVACETMLRLSDPLLVPDHWREL